MTLKELFDSDDLDPRLEALDLMTSYHCTMRFLEIFQSAILDVREQNRSVKDIYIDYLHSLNLINTVDDLPKVLTGRQNNPNEKQAVRNIKFPMGLGSLAAYMTMNLGIAKEIVGDKLPKKSSDEIKSAWFFDEFEIIKDESSETPTVSRVITRLRNAVSHHKFKLRIPDSRIHEPDVRDRVEVSFYDTDGKLNNDFYAKATFRTVEKLMEKLRHTEYTFHNCPTFEGDISNFDEFVEYIDNCFTHFNRPYLGRGLKFEGLRKLSPMEAYELATQSGVLEMSRSDCLKFEVCFSLKGEPRKFQYIDIPFINNQRWGNIMIEDELFPLGDYPIEWMLNHQMSPLCRLDKKIREMMEKSLLA
ncbi:hypothetical protein [Pseudomonas sp. F01002]|uniref:hypothetical protein n=1 Tax=Pseudomonas sp. F01002 TaxID=2555724 RepID=UPI00106B3A43|nr:hypothetical protein [Pseudomonas sp. F01002]TFB44157.1 hypothetical protein E3W21_04590 [Pseudomonas sp. F01002]